jgi:hypothetical protein
VPHRSLRATLRQREGNPRAATRRSLCAFNVNSITKCSCPALGCAKCLSLLMSVLPFPTRRAGEQKPPPALPHESSARGSIRP